MPKLIAGSWKWSIIKLTRGQKSSVSVHLSSWEQKTWRHSGVNTWGTLGREISFLAKQLFHEWMAGQTFLQADTVSEHVLIHSVPRHLGLREGPHGGFTGHFLGHRLWKSFSDHIIIKGVRVILATLLLCLGCLHWKSSCIGDIKIYVETCFSHAHVCELACVNTLLNLSCHITKHCQSVE